MDYRTHTIAAPGNSPRARFIRAQRAYLAAQEACPHWDYEEGGCAAECCRDLDRAELAYRNARAAMMRAREAA